MANWAPLRALLNDTDEAVVLPWEYLEELVGGLPPSASAYPAFWSGDRSTWAGFKTRNVRLGESVTFERIQPTSRNGETPPDAADAADLGGRVSGLEAALTTAQEAIAGLAARVRNLEAQRGR